MKQAITALFAACTLCGCATQGTRLTSAPPMRPESTGLFLEIESRKGPYGAPFTVLLNVTIHTLQNTSIPVWSFPRTVFYAEQEGEFFALRRIETHSGGISRPYGLTGLSVMLPRPPRPGKWRIFAIQEHSEMVYARHLESHKDIKPLRYAGEQDESGTRLWIKPLVSNSIFVEFAELDKGQMRSAESVIQGLIDAEQYDLNFREQRDDPTRQIQHAR